MSNITREQYYDYVKDSAETPKVEVSETQYYMEIFDLYYNPKRRKSLFLSWHWMAFIFGPFWFAYRKMYQWAIAFWILSILFSIEGGLTIFLIQGLLGNSLYLNKITTAIENNDTSAKGQSILSIFVTLFIMIILGVIVYKLKLYR